MTETFILVVNSSLASKYNGPIHYDDSGLDVRRKVRFFLYTRKTAYKPPEQLYLGDSSRLGNTRYNVSKPTKFVTHGWNTNYTSDCCAKVVQGTK